MKKRSFLVAGLIIILTLTCTIGWTINESKQPSSKSTWEYKSVSNPSDATLNELGARGWELAGVAAWNYEGVSQTTLYFKRAR